MRGEVVRYNDAAWSQDCQEIRVWAGIMGKKESHHVPTQGAAIPADLLDQLLAGTDAATTLDQGGLLDSLKKALTERALNAEMDHHLGHDDQAGNNRGASRPAGQL